ncbi:MAG TPA: hypothetical protein VHB97_22015 [Polyangia bacterium]|nr:hypothetical protein [Polyangia bacterium]
MSATDKSHPPANASSRKKGLLLIVAGAVLILCDTILVPKGHQIVLAGTMIRIWILGALAMALGLGMFTVHRGD